MMPNWKAPSRRRRKQSHGCGNTSRWSHHRMNKPQHPVPGQRWISDTEPELGLGVIVEVEAVMVSVEFPAAGERRRYARQSAPLRRVRFQAGDRIQGAEGNDTEVLSISERDGLLYYQTAA